MEFLKLENGVEIAHVFFEGEQDKPVLVFLHEGLGCTAMWHDFPERLSRMTGCPGFSYDRPGFGLSSPVTKERQMHYLHENALFELPMVLEALIPERNYILVGHSDGGAIALLHASERPPGLKAAITEAAHVFVEDITIRGIKNTVADYAKGKLTGLAKYHGDRTDAVFKAWAGIWLRRDFRAWNIEYALSSIEKPFFLIQGVRDKYATEAQVEKIVAGIPGEKAILFVENCGHMPHIEQKELVLKEMVGFIQEQL